MSWESLKAINDEARAMRAEDKAKPIVDCPICGFTLEENKGVFNCPMGHFRQRGAQRGPDSW